MTLKEQIAKARKVEDIRHELDTYQNAIKSGSKFEEDSRAFKKAKRNLKLTNLNRRHLRMSFFIRAPHVSLQLTNWNYYGIIN